MIGRDIVTIALPWHTLGHANLGVDALARSNIAIADEALASVGLKGRFITIGLGAPPQPEQMPSNVTIGPSPRIKSLIMGRIGALKAIRGADFTIDISEGDSFSDIYGFKRFFYHFGTKATSVLSGTPLIIAPQTIGPFNNAIVRFLARWVMNKSQAVFARDGQSYAFIESMGTRSRKSEYIDVAFALPYSRDQRSDDGFCHVGLNVSGLLYRDGYTGKNEFGLKFKYKNLTDAIINYFRSVPGVKLHIVPHVLSPGSLDDDLDPLADILAQHPDLIVAPRFSSASQAKSYIAGLDFMIAGRMHACIAAFSSSVPVIPIAYSRKFNGLFDTLQYPYYIDGKADSEDDALAKIKLWFGDTKPLCDAIARGNELANARLNAYRSDLAGIFASHFRAA